MSIPMVKATIRLTVPTAVRVPLSFRVPPGISAFFLILECEANRKGIKLQRKADKRIRIGAPV